MKNWKTTSAGVTAIVGGVAGLYYAYISGSITVEVCTAATTAILTGIGLVFAKDSNVTGQ